MQTVVWTVDHPSWVERAVALGLRVVITNEPARMCAARDEFAQLNNSQLGEHRHGKG